MRPVEIGTSYRTEVHTKPGDLASALGNTGVDVISSPATIGYLEMACHGVLDEHFDAGEASVGVGFNLRHLAAAHLEAPLEVYAELIEKSERLLTFKVEARQDGRIIMTGTHERAVINLNRFLKKEA